MIKINLPQRLRKHSQVLLYKWLKNIGDPVSEQECLCVIQAGADLFEVQTPASGFLLEVLPARGSVFSTDTPLAVLGEKGQDASAILAPYRPKSASAPLNASQASQETLKTGDSLMKHETKPTAAGHGPVIPILMPQAGQSMEEGTILSWKVQEGDRIEVGQVIMEIETDKATMEVEAVDAGRLARIVHREGDIVEVKQPVAFLADNDADVDSLLAGEGLVTPAATPASPAPAQQTLAVPEGAVTPILMPQAGQSMEEGTILGWKVQEGDRIEFGQVIMEIETDKATMEVEAVDAGRIAKIVAAQGEIVEVKKPVAYLAEDNVDINAYLAATTGTPTTTSAASPAASQPKESAFTAQKTTASVSDTGRVKASPAARKAAKQAGVDLASIGAGSGPGGRILSTDLENVTPAAAGTRTYPVTKMRRAIANNLLYSKQNVPHFYAKTTIDAGALFDLYRKTKEQFKCSVNDFITAACAKAMRQYPAFRSQYKNTEIVEYAAVNIGIAVGTDDGLTVPVVLNADKLSLKDLAAKTRQVVESARSGKLEGLGQGLFTITNLGMFGVEEFSAIINPPESAILAVGAIREGVAVENGQMRPTRLMTVTLSSDHRIVDGVVAAQFLKTVKEMLEKPEQLVK
jgi:pyruvate dehydrogenase E2 component (dihydrolipoamide acetyltransferase)